MEELKGKRKKGKNKKRVPRSDDLVFLEGDDSSNPKRPASLPMSLSEPLLSIQRDDHVLDNKADDIALEDFLANLEIEDTEHQLPIASLLKLFQHEMGTCSVVKWSSVDHAFEKLLQWPLLSSKDLAPDAKSASCSRIRPTERSIPLQSSWGLVKAYGAQGFTRGLELGIFTSIHSFIYAMLLYRLIVIIQTGQTNWDDFRASFSGSDQQGIDSLVHLLAHVEARWLKLILASPLIIGAVQSISSMWGAKPIPLEKLIQEIDQHLAYSRWWRDGIYESLPGISSISSLSVSGKLSKLESAVRWDGRLTPKQRKEAFDAITRVARRGKKTVRLNALQCLAKIAHGVGFKDLARLKAAGYLPEELTAILYTKGKALEVLETALLDDDTFSSAPLRIYQQYLLWWLLGLKTKMLRQQLPFSLSKAAKLAVEFYFFQLILSSILEAIRCPDKPGFELGFGYSQYATELTIDCYLQMINQFRTVNLSDSVQQLVEQTQYFNLQGLDSLLFWYKNLTGDEMIAILQSAEVSGANWAELQIYDYLGAATS